MEKFIRTENLSFSYPMDDEAAETTSAFALNDVNIDIDSGEYVAVLGHNGSGKSTFAKLLNLIIVPQKGKIFMDGKDITANADEMSDEEIFAVRRKVGMVFQNPDNQLVANVVEEDVAFGPENLGIPREEIRQRVDEALKTVGMTEYSQHAPHRLSGGQKQRIAIAGIIAMMPKCIILDEATAMLDPVGRKEVMNTIEMLNREKNMTVIHITHYMEEAVRADRVIVINDSRVYMDGTPKEVFSRIEDLKKVGLEAPQGTELLFELGKLGYSVPNDCLSVEECANALYDLIEREQKR
ncbi:MAG: energy-coupling factor transporter ATPase [Ruminococcaceae bacterium]|nr:energy-coupling factor transporter ATPase [Oscillospiraceae bacterium]